MDESHEHTTFLLVKFLKQLDDMYPSDIIRNILKENFVDQYILGQTPEDEYSESTQNKESVHILWVDDEAEIVELGREILEFFGYLVVTLTNSREALELFKAEPQRFDLVITDFSMPEINGFELADQIKAIRPDIPMVLCTGYKHIPDTEQAAAFSDMVSKPILLGRLTEAVRTALCQSSGSRDVGNC